MDENYNREKDVELLNLANSNFKTIPIDKKDKNGNVTTSQYVNVPERIKAFRFIYPRGSIRTEQKYLIGESPNRIVGYHCEVFDDSHNFLSDGDAEEKESSTFVNRTSFIENCQTSAIGRALGFAGIGIDADIASYEETANAIANQNEEDEEPIKLEYATEGQIKIINDLYDEAGLNKIYEFFKVKSLNELKLDDAIRVIKNKKKGE